MRRELHPPVRYDQSHDVLQNADLVVATKPVIITKFSLMAAPPWKIFLGCCSIGRCGHVYGLRLWAVKPLAIRLCADRLPEPIVFIAVSDPVAQGLWRALRIPAATYGFL
jgi:hypothetical protein